MLKRCSIKLGERTKKRTTTTILTLKNLRSFIPKGRFLTFLNSYLSPVIKFGEYRFASFVLTPLVILLRIYLVSICFYIGNILLERVHKTTTWKTYFHVSLKADFALILAPLLNCCLILYAGTDFAANIMQKTSLLYFFDVDSLDAWMVIPISLFNIFEFLYFLFVSMLLSVATNRTYRDSMNFVTSTYCTGLILYIIIVVFIVLCIVE